MTRLVIPLALVFGFGVGCGAKAPPGPTGTGEPMIAKKVSLSWGIEPQGEMADIYLATTDETGKQVSHPLGRYKGKCAPSTPAPAMNAVIGVICSTGGTGTEMHAVVQGDEIIVLKLGIDPGVTQDPMSREEVIRVPIIRGAKVEAGS